MGRGPENITAVRQRDLLFDRQIRAMAMTSESCWPAQSWWDATRPLSMGHGFPRGFSDMDWEAMKDLKLPTPYKPVALLPWLGEELQWAKESLSFGAFLCFHL